MPIFNKKIASSVGRLGSNLATDMRIIKYLLNNVPQESGGPSGVILESTSLNELIGSIEAFQKASIGRSDGRVDPEGRTLNSLREFDPTPGDPPFVPTTLSGKKNPRSNKKGGVPLPASPKRIVAAVGVGAFNLAADVEMVKHLLNNVSVQRGGPAEVILKQTPLDQLVVHIGNFQRQQLGFSDGRVDPDGVTLRKLRSFDPLPNGEVFVPSSRSGPKSGKRG